MHGVIEAIYFVTECSGRGWTPNNVIANVYNICSDETDNEMKSLWVATCQIKQHSIFLLLTLFPPERWVLWILL